MLAFFKMTFLICGKLSVHEDTSKICRKYSSRGILVY